MTPSDSLPDNLVTSKTLLVLKTTGKLLVTGACDPGVKMKLLTSNAKNARAAAGKSHVGRGAPHCAGQILNEIGAESGQRHDIRHRYR